MILTLLALAAIGVYQLGISSSTLNQTLPQLAVAVVTAIVLDVAIKWYELKKFVIPKSATITGLFVGSLLNPGTSLLLVLATVVIAILSKHVIRVKKINVFNPAAFGLVVGDLLFKVGSAWWSASSIVAIFVLGIIVLYRIKRFVAAFTFIAVFDLLFAISSTQLVLKSPTALLNPLVLFFAFFMLIEHKTSPLTLKSEIAYSIIVGVLAFAFFAYVDPLKPIFLLSALLVGNAFNTINNRMKLFL